MGVGETRERNKEYPWFKWHEGAVPAFERCSLAERGLLISLAAYYLKYSYTMPTDMAVQLDLDADELASVWTPRAQRSWEFVRLYLEDERVENTKKREAVQQRKAAARAKKAAKE